MRQSITPRLVNADLVALGYFAFGILFGGLSVALAATDAADVFIFAYVGLSVLLLVCAVAIDRAARPGFCDENGYRPSACLSPAAPLERDSEDEADAY